MSNDGWLTVKDVEDIHHAVMLGTDARRISAAISRFHNITLPALIEFNCLRWAFPTLPSLPSEFHQTLLGQSFRSASSDLSLISSGRSVPRPNDLNARSSEFWAFSSPADVASDAAEFYKNRFWKSATTVGFSRTVANYLAAGLHEMMTNAAQHSESSVPMVAGYLVLPNFAQFCVGDVGRGVLAALRASDQHKSVTLHADAIRLVIHDGVTSDPSGSGGFGFHDIFKALTQQWGYLRFRSGEACLLADGTALDADAGENRPVPLLPGFQVSVSCRAGSAGPEHPTV